MAGIDKHKWSWAMKYDKNHFDKHGFVRPQGTSVDVDTINLYYINQRAMLNQLEKKNGKLYFEFDGKILAVGNLSVPVVIRASAWSKGVEAKVKTAGGELVKLGKAAAKPAA